MAGPTVMALGPFQFESYGLGPANRRRAIETGWAEMDLAGAENTVQWTGTRWRGEVIRGVVFKSMGGQLALEGIKLAARNGVPLPFVDLGGFPNNIIGMHVIEGVSEDHSFIDRTGAPLRNAYSIAIRSAPLDLSAFGTISVLSLFA